MRDAARGRFALALALWLVPEALGALAEARPESDRAARRDRRSGEAIVAGCCLAAVAALAATRFLPRAAFPPASRGPAALAGDTLVVAGTALRWVAIARLGPAFTRFVTVPDDLAIVERGPYRYVRHPSYTGVFVSFAGFGLGLGNGAALVAIGFCLWPVFAYRVAVEEAAMEERLGAPYAAYRSRTKRFLPYLF